MMIFILKNLLYTLLKNEDDDVVPIFVDTLEENRKQISNNFKFPKKMIFGNADAKR